MAKVITPQEACAIGKKYREEAKENYFLDIMRVIGERARHENVVVFADRPLRSMVDKNDVVNYFIANPEQVTRLTNMGYVIEQSEEEVPASYPCEEQVTVPYLYFWSKQEYKTTTKEIMLTLRKFQISWECEDCDGRDEETI